MNVGTYDYYFDMADQLEKLGTQFTLALKHPGHDSVVVMSNVQESAVAAHMLRATRHTFRERFNSNPDQGNGI